MSWRSKVSDWLSEGALSKNQQQAELAKAKLKQYELTIDKLNAEKKQDRVEIEQLNAQLQIYRGFQVELGETQKKLSKAIAASEDYRTKLPATEKELDRVKRQLQQVQKSLSRSPNWQERLNSKVRVVDIQKRLPKQEFDALWGFGVSSPEVNSLTIAGSVVIKGWVLGRKSPVSQLRIIYQQETLIEIPVNLSRPEVTDRYPEIPKADKSGFEVAISVTDMPSEVELELQAVFQDQTTIPLCAIFFKAETNN